MISFLLFLVFFAEIKWFDPREAAIYHIWQTYYLLHLLLLFTTSVPYLKDFETSQLKFETAELY